MPPIIIGYGDYSEYRLNALPTEALEELALRYPLTLPEESSPDFDDLAITVAVHAEVTRRKVGGQQERHTPSRRKLAQMVVNRGFQQASKQHHPDVDGHHESQVRLSHVRDELLDACENISDDRPDAAIIIPAPPARREPKPRAATKVWDDDDVPF